MTSHAYANDKALWHADRIDALREGRAINPVHVQMVLSDLCNHACDFCAFRWEGYTTNELFPVLNERSGKLDHNPARLVTTAKALEILDDCAALGVRAVQFTGGGEPTVHPEHHAVFRHALDLGLDLGLVTNGVLLKPDTIRTLTRATWVRLSLDAGTPETYRASRRVSARQFHLALGHLRELCAARAGAPRRATVGVGFVVTRENWREAEQAALLARESGADYLRISAVFQPEGHAYFEDFHAEAEAACRRCEALATEDFQVINLYGDRLADLRQGRPEVARCGYQHFTTYIGADLNVYRCCNTAYSRRGLVGSLEHQRLRDLWTSGARREDFERFDARGCERCQFNDKNRAIFGTRRLSLPVLAEPPPHVNFV